MASSSLLSRRALSLGLVVALGVGTLLWRQQQHRKSEVLAPFSVVSESSPGPEQTGKSLGADAIEGHQAPLPPSAPEAIASPEPAAKASPSREMDLAVNPYAPSLQGPGKSKRTWDANYITSFRNAKNDDPVRFELTNGVVAEGRVKMIQLNGGLVSYVSGELTAPEMGKFFFLTPPEGGKAGKAVGVVEFPASKTAYRIEPTGANGDPELWQRRLDEVVCMNMAEEDSDHAHAEAEEIVPLRPDQVPDYVPSYNSEIVSLQSYPGSQAVMLLDFAGGYTSSWGGVTYARPAIDNGTIKDIWKRVAEDYMPFNINVTTDFKVFQAAPAASRQRCCFTTTPITAAGVAYFGSWNWGNDTVCWSVYYVGKAAAEVAAHEVGHTLGLAHQGQNGGVEYYGGQGGGETGWAPIMGVGYYQAVTTWAKGEYSNANQPQDELLTISTTNNNVAYRDDDTGATLAASRYLEVDASNNVSAEGVIERTGDTDAFQFTTTGGAVNITVNPVAPGDWGDLATKATLADANDTVIATYNAQDDVSSNISTTLAAGTYTFRVTGVGKNDPVTNGFSDYASLGYYSIAGTVAGARKPTRLTVAERAANNTVVGTVPATNPNSSPLTYTITSGNTGSTFTVDNSGTVRVANNALLDYYTLAANPSLYAAQFEVFMTIANVNNPALTETNRRVLINVQQLYAPKPTELVAALASSLRVDLGWTESFGATGYSLKRSTTPGGPYTTIATPVSGSFTDGGLISGVTYYYVVTAVNANGESNPSAEASVLASSVAGGFESPAIGAGNYRYNPGSGSSGWTFGGTAGDGSGIVSNGSGFNNPTAPEGTQAAFLQSHGSISQTFSGFTPGSSYTISYLAAQRPGNQQSWDVVLDGNVIKSNTPGSGSYSVYTATFTATAAAHTLAFVGTNTAGGDNTVFIDNVQIGIVAPATPNFSFETPNIGTGSGAYRYAPTGGSWTFNGAGGNGSGIAANGSAFAPPNAPHGTQVAFVQSFGTITQTLSGFTPGKAYTLSYLAAQRGGGYGGETWDVKIGSTVIQSNVAGSNNFTPYTVNFTASAASQTLAFVGTNLAGGDRTVFIDNVSIGARDSLLPVAAAVAISSPANNAVFLPNAPIDLTATVTANGNLINGVQFFIDGTMIGQINSAPYTCAWGKASAGKHSAFARVLFNGGSIADSAFSSFVVGTTNPNLGFETPNIGGSQYRYDITGNPWKFSGTGICSNGSAFGNPNAPEGSQVGFVQFQGTTSQLLTGFVPGTNYTLTYSSAQRSGNQQTWDVKLDNTVIQSGSGGGSSFTTRTANFTATAAAHTLSFTGTNLNGGDNTIFIDNLSFNPPLATNPGPALVANVSPATAVDVVGSEVSFTAAFASSLGITSYQWQKLVNGQATNIAGATTPTLTLSNLQMSDAGDYRLKASSAAGVSVSKVSTLTVTGLPAAVDNVVVSYAAQTSRGSEIPIFSPTWSVSPGSLISSQSPASVGTGDFHQTTAILTDGNAGKSTFGDGGSNASQVTCGSGGGAGQSVTYNLGSASGGYNLSNIVVYGGWTDDGRDQQAYTVSYSTVSDPATFTQLAIVNYNPANPADVPAATRATLKSADSAPLASNVAALKFDFTTPAPENGWCGYTEIAVYGAPLGPAVIANTSPATARDVVGSQVTFSASIVGAAPLTYQWQKVVGGVPGNIAGATGSTLTLSNLQTSDTASYQLKATNAQGTVTSAPASLTVIAVSAPVNNVITSLAAQTGLGGNTTFVPGWSLTAESSLIGGLSPSSSGGNFNLNSNNRPLHTLTTPRSLAISQTSGGDNSINYLSCGNGSGAGSSLVYTLPANSSGHTLTKIMVHGGWADAGRDQQAYTVSYSKVATPTTFVTLGSVNYNPPNSTGVQSTTRATLTAANGVLATNVAAVKFDFTTPASENGWLGYGQLAVYGTPTLSSPINLTATAGDAKASLAWTASPGATSYNVKRSTVNGASYTTVGTVTGTDFVNTGLNNGMPYYYVVTALNATEETGSSAQVSVTPVATGYEGWLAGYPSITGPNRSPDADPDGDGQPNGIEFMTGTSPASSASSAPVTATRDGSGNLVLQFKRVDAAKAYSVTVESTSDFTAPWTSVTVPLASIAGPPITVLENGSAADDITVVIPGNGVTEKFARVRIAIPAIP